MKEEDSKRKPNEECKCESRARDELEKKNIQ